MNRSWQVINIANITNTEIARLPTEALNICDAVPALPSPSKKSKWNLIKPQNLTMNMKYRGKE